MEVGNLRIFLLLLLTAVRYSRCLDDLIAEESQTESKTTLKDFDTEPVKKYSSKIRAIDDSFGGKISPKKTVLDFRIEEGLKASAAGNGKSKEDDDDEKTLAQQVADGKYGLIQNEIFPHGSKRPGIISYLPNPEVPKDTKEDFGGLDKDEIWLAEDHVLVLRGGNYPQAYNETAPTPWRPIDDYVAPPRQVSIPKNPKIPPPFPIQLTENGPLEIIRGENGSLPPRPPFFPPFPLPPLGENKTFPFPVPPGPLPPFLANLPPGAAFLPPPGNMTEIDEDDPSIYYPPKYDFYYPLDNTTAVPPGPLVPGIILPPPPNFFAPDTSDTPKDEDNETDSEDNPTKKPPFIAPAYLPSNRKPINPRTTTKKPPGRKETTTVTFVYPERGVRLPRPTRPPPSFAPIYVPNMVLPPINPPTPLPRPSLQPIYYPSPTPKPHHITIPKNQTLKQDIFIITTEPPESDNSILDLFKDVKPAIASTLDDISPERHPLRSLIKPNVSVNYIGKVGHLPPSTPFPFPRTEQTTKESFPESGHFITFPPTVTVSQVPIVKKIKVRPPEAPTQGPHATLYFYEEPKATQPTPIEENEVSPSPLEQFIKENLKSDAPEYQIKTLKSPVYVPKIRIRPKPKTTYTPPEEVPKLNALEVDSHGLSGLSTELPINQHGLITVTPPNLYGPTTDGPFIPSNYYATANPAAIHFTGMDPSVVDDITMKYFTLFGQKLNAGGTTPLTPAPPTSSPYKPLRTKIYTTTETPKSYVTITTPKPSPPAAQTYFHVSTPKPPRPTMHFEQYLKEITGEDQNDFIITHNSQTAPKIKKPKARPGFSENPKYFEPPKFYLPYRSPEISQYLENVYRPTPSTTLRPTSDIHLKPQYFQQISTTYKPFVAPQQRPPKPLDHNFGQFLQEVTYTNVKRPPTSTSNLQFFDASTHSAVRQQYRPNDRHPVSLEGDILVNYQRPLPAVNPDAELISGPYSTSNSNIKVVNAPDLANRIPYRPNTFKAHRRPPAYEPTKTFFENLPHSGYFNPAPSTNTANAFVSYNLPGNGGHFYFLTPQAVDRSDTDDEESPGYSLKRSYDNGPLRTTGRSRPSSHTERRDGPSDTSQDYLRRRRKKP